MSDYLPQRVMINILTRLPSKSLVRFRCVSKSWNSLITRQTFINMHLSHSKTNNPLLLLSYSDIFKNECFSLRVDKKESLIEYLELELPYKSEYKWFHVVGSFNGVICLLENRNIFLPSIILWNPSIRKSFTLPLLSYGTRFYGFGFDSWSNDYKVVTILLQRGEHYVTMQNHTIEVEVYSLNAASWKSIEVNLDLFSVDLNRWNQAFFNGVVHWIACREVKAVKQSFVLAFDFRDELFEEIMLPESLASEGKGSMWISAFENSLAVLQYKLDKYHLWVMEEYGVVESWAKKFSIDTSVGLGRAVGFRKNGELLMERNFTSLVSCDPCSQTIHDLGIAGNHQSFKADFYVESLVLLNERKGKDAKSLGTSSKKRKQRFFDLVQEAKHGDGTSNKEGRSMINHQRRNEAQTDSCLGLLQVPSLSKLTTVLVQQYAEQQRDGKIKHGGHPPTSKRIVKRVSMDEMSSLFAEFESELSPTPASFSANANSSSSFEAKKSSDIQAAWQRVTDAISVGPSLLHNSEDVTTLKEALKLLSSLEPQGKISKIQMTVITRLEQEIDQLESKFKKADETLGKTAAIRIMKDQAGKHFFESFNHFKKLKAKDDKLVAQMMKLKADLKAKEAVHKENQEKMTDCFSVGESYKESATKCQQDLDQLSHAERQAKKDKAEVEHTFRSLQIDLS